MFLRWEKIHSVLCEIQDQIKLLTCDSLRETDEWEEFVDIGWIKICETDLLSFLNPPWPPITLDGKPIYRHPSENAVLLQLSSIELMAFTWSHDFLTRYHHEHVSAIVTNESGIEERREMRYVDTSLMPKLFPERLTEEVKPDEANVVWSIDESEPWKRLPSEVPEVVRVILEMAIRYVEIAIPVIDKQHHKSNNSSRTAKYLDVNRDERDQWIYNLAVKGEAWKTILMNLQECAVQQGWGLISTEAGIRDRAFVYAERNDLPLPEKRTK